MSGPIKNELERIERARLRATLDAARGGTLPPPKIEESETLAEIRRHLRARVAELEQEGTEPMTIRRSLLVALAFLAASCWPVLAQTPCAPADTTVVEVRFLPGSQVPAITVRCGVVPPPPPPPDTTPAEPTVARVLILPREDTVTVGDTLRWVAQAVDSAGRQVVLPPGTVVVYTSLDTSLVRVDAQTGVGLALAPATAARVRLASSVGAGDTATIVIEAPPPPPPPPPGASLTPAALLASMGPLVRRGTAPTAETDRHDQRYLQTEGARYQNFLGCTSGCITTANHYGGLRSRLQWAIRNGEPIGTAAVDETFAYGRGRRIVRTYLAYSKQSNFATQPHNNTGLADVEAYWLLEGDPDARNHIWVTAAMGTRDNFGYTNCTNVSSDARGPTVGLQSMSASHRLAIPHTRPPANTSIATDMSRGSWLADGKWLIDRILTGCVEADGSIPSPAHGGQEAFLFNGWLAATLLQWHGYVEPHAVAADAAKRIVDHILVVDAQREAQGWSTLGYTTNSTVPAEDLAGYYVYPALVLWQETGDAK